MQAVQTPAELDPPLAEGDVVHLLLRVGKPFSGTTTSAFRLFLKRLLRCYGLVNEGQWIERDERKESA